MNHPTTPALSFPKTLLANLKPGLFAVPLGILALSACWARLAGFAGTAYPWAAQLSVLLLDVGCNAAPILAPVRGLIVTAKTGAFATCLSLCAQPWRHFNAYHSHRQSLSVKVSE